MNENQKLPVKEKQTRLTRDPQRIIESLRSLSLDDKALVLSELKVMVAKEKEDAVKDATALLEKMKNIVP